MIISYYIPEDGDTLDHPNFFVADSNSLTLGQLKKIFPVPGEYHFRFKRTIGSTTVWMDATNDTSVVPVDSTGNVFSKVTRISLGNIQPAIQNIPQKAPAPPPEILLATSPKATTPKSMNVAADQPKTRERRNSDKLLSFDNFDDPAPPQSQPVAAAFNDFLDFSAPTSSTSSVPAKSDLFGFDDITSPTSIPLGAPVHRSHSGSSIPALPMQQSNGANSPMRGGPMGGSGRGGPMNPMGGPMSGRGTNIMGFDAFNNMTPNQNPPPYRGQPGRR